MDSIKDYSERKSLEIQIQEFGQIPTQLFKEAHLPKAKLLEIDMLINSPDIVESNLEQENPTVKMLEQEIDQLKIQSKKEPHLFKT